MKRNSIGKHFYLVASLLFFALTVLAQEKNVTVATQPEWHQNKVDALYTNKRISDAAEEFKDYAPIPRVAFYDIGYPKDKAEFEELNGYGLLLISAVSQKETELPLKRVYILLDGKEIELKSLKQILTKEENSKSQVVKTFGAYRVDSLYLFPVYLRTQTGAILVDFAQNRNGMKIADFDGDIPEVLKDMPNRKPSERKVSDAALERFMKREYPGFYEAK